MLQSYGVVAHKILVSAQGPLVLGFWVWGLRVWGQGLTISESTGLSISIIICHLVINVRKLLDGEK